MRLWKIILSIIILVIVVGICLTVFLYDYDKLSPDHPKGKNIYYTIISGKGIKGDSGRYNYEFIAYDENGEGKKVKVSADKQLTEGAYIQLYYAKFRGITYWEEIDFEELPTVVKKKYK